jgi:hypothetical protein
MFTGTFERAIIETLAYSDVFEYPLRLNEIYRYLPVQVRSEQISQKLSSLHDHVGERDGYYYLTGRENIVGTRNLREARSRRLIQPAIKYGRILGALPFIRMVALTGSLAVMNSSADADLDYMLVAASGRVWTARAYALLFNRITRLFGHMLCPNLIISENALAWSRHDLYSARELCQMIPISGLDVYQKLMKANGWLKEFLPNATVRTLEVSKNSGVWWQRLTELPLRGKLGDQLERWERMRKIARFSKQEDFGEETIFNADMCQGNFDHHRKRIQETFHQKMDHLIMSSPDPVGDAVKVNV